MTLRRTLLAAASTSLLVVSLGLPGSANAQACPSRSVSLIVSFPPGGDTDALARLFGEKLAARIGQPVVVENKTGASGTIGNGFVATGATVKDCSAVKAELEKFGAIA